VLGHAVETVTAVFVALPGLLLGAGVGGTDGTIVPRSEEG
jgi:hypothetical protein